MSLADARASLLSSTGPWVMAVFGGAVFTSAALLFAVQPLFAKMVLPVLGGSPGVWSVAMVFFQTVLLFGYAYAHALTTWLNPRVAVILHVMVLAGASLALPLGIAAGWGRPPASGEAFWLLGLFAASIGLPFFALSANGPLLQAWFARTGHVQARNPYVLYAASNVGSFLALFAYPFLIEPLSTLGVQITAWSQGFYLLIALVAACGVTLVRALGPDGRELDRDRASASAAPAPRIKAIIGWIGLSCVPSALLVAVTAHLSTDVAAAPFLWVLPLGLFLLTFVVVFQDRPVIPHRLMVMVQPFLLVAVILSLAKPALLGSLAVQIGLHLAAFFVTAMVCHGELANRRPAPRHLTAFYLWMSFGGVVGGVFAGLLAPQLFNWVVEYPLMLVLAVLCRPGASWQAIRTDRIAQGLAVACVILLVPASLFGVAPRLALVVAATAVMGLALVAAMLWRGKPLRLALSLVLALGVVRVYQNDSGDTRTTRSFFGVHRVVTRGDGQFRLLQHGTTFHGAERLADASGRPPAGRPEPLSYYHSAGPLGGALVATRERLGRPIRVGVVGLGSGSLACYAEAGDDWRFFEIDSEIERIARRDFSFLRSCTPRAPVILGDARLTLAEGEQGALDVLVIDAFSSDSIPGHLLTREAMAIYRKKIAPGGMIVMHISNRHMRLGPVVAAIAADQGMAVRVNDYTASPDQLEEMKFGVIAAIVAEQPTAFGALDAARGWHDQDGGTVRPWTDDYSNILGAIIAHYRR
ncbi:fused MFS/spermidine synthase [Phreatobacter stygius]|uniref:Class I SAM-dependent methyltransferase n=1 Tax=Phreatobacter stygius TaxID=1940610 RepID=A0A4D7B5S7_9HYPH|nr:fused MFS/spermidine synthase [Phreatobacter stygius]QCI68371.1 class I SAM-dependent methyltransferase [Phreatobacter stygius]